MSRVIEVNDLFDEEFNQIMIDFLTIQGVWNLGKDFPDHDEFSDSGLLYCTYNLEDTGAATVPNEFLNSIATLIFEKVIRRIERNPGNFFPTRFLYNYYNRSSEGGHHKDVDELGVRSIIYYFNTCDGGTYVKDDFFKSEAGKAIIFPSNIWHKGVGPKKDKQRFVLNIVYRER